nr:hypothetical protein [Tanacetum cinerariifolium]
WVEILAKIATNYALSKQLLGDDVTKDNMNERLGMLLLRKRRELAEQSRGGGDFVSSPQSNKAPQTPVATADGGVEDSVALTALSLKLDRKPFSSFPSAHVPENVPAGAGIFAAATTIPTGSPMDAAVYAAVSPSYSIPTAADKGKEPMVDGSLPVDLLSEQERVFKNLHDSQLGEELAKKIHAEQEAEFARQQEDVIGKSNFIVVPDSEDTLMHAEESRSKMIEKQNDPQMIEKKVITKPIDYASLNQLSTDFNTQFVPQTESYAEQAFWFQYSVQTDEPNLSGTTIVEVPKELCSVLDHDW